MFSFPWKLSQRFRASTYFILHSYCIHIRTKMETRSNSFSVRRAFRVQSGRPDVYPMLHHFDVIDFLSRWVCTIVCSVEDVNEALRFIAKRALLFCHDTSSNVFMLSSVVSVNPFRESIYYWNSKTERRRFPRAYSFRNKTHEFSIYTINCGVRASQSEFCLFPLRRVWKECLMKKAPLLRARKGIRSRLCSICSETCSRNKCKSVLGKCKTLRSTRAQR